MSNSSRPHGLQPTRLLHPWDFPGKSTGVGCHCLLPIYIFRITKFCVQVVQVVKNMPANAGDTRDAGSIPGSRKSSENPHTVLLLGKSHGRSLVGCSPWDREESDMTERLHFHFSLSCIGEGNGNPLQCSCLENPRDGEAWWAAVSGVAQSRTRLKRLSSRSCSHPRCIPS